MGNKFSNKTNIILRPKVCKSPPPPPTPEPPTDVVVTCCVNPLPIDMQGKVSNSLFCPGFTGQTFAMVYSSVTAAWHGSVVILGKNFTFKTWCPLGGTTIADWKLDIGGDCVVGSGGPPTGPNSCSPFKLRWQLAMNLGICPAICAGPARQWIFEQQP